MTYTAPVQPSTTRGAGARLAGWAGVAFFVLFPVGLLFAGNDLEGKDSDAKWHDWYSDSGHRSGNIIGIYLMIIAAIAFVVFASGLLERLRVEGAWLAHRVAATTGTVFAVV